MGKKLLVLLVCLTAAACGDRSEPAADEAANVRLAVARRACISSEIARDSKEQLDMLAMNMDSTQQLTLSVMSFARAFDRHARLRMAAYSQADSALNHSSTPADSARHARAAASFQVRTPDPQSVEANAAAEYERQLDSILADPNHPCNWRPQLEQANQPADR